MNHSICFFDNPKRSADRRSSYWNTLATTTR